MQFPISDAEASEIAATLRRRHKDLAWSEDCLLRLIIDRKSKMDVYWSALGLRNCGTSRSIQALKDLATHPVQDIKAVAMLTIAQVAGASESEYYAHCLVDPKYRAKGYALWAIGACGDGRALDAVHSYIKRRRRALAEKPFDPREQQEIVAFFYRVLGPVATLELLATQYGFIKESLASGLNSLPAVATRHFIERVPAIKDSLGLQQLP